MEETKERLKIIGLIEEVAEINKQKISLLLGIMFDKANEKYCSVCKSNCCKDCVNSRGYFFGLGCGAPKLEKKYHFSKKNGYLDVKKKRCKLPRSMRSSTCLRHVCHPVGDHLPLSRMEITRIVDIYRTSKELLGEKV